MNLLLFSNGGSPRGYLAHAITPIREFRAEGKALFIPFAAVDRNWDDYEMLVRDSLAPSGIHLESIHRKDDALSALKMARVVVVGGGNTFNLLRECRRLQLLGLLAQRIREGLPYIGWSAGTVLCSPTIRTTNDMPIVDPEGLDALGVVPFQFNCHYTQRVLPDHMGESRDQRLYEFLQMNPAVPVLALPEGDWIRVRDARYELGGPHPAFWMLAARQRIEITAGQFVAAAHTE
jgi:dipeptidase E